MPVNERLDTMQAGMDAMRAGLRAAGEACSLREHLKHDRVVR